MKNKTITVTDTVINSEVATIYNATMVLTSTGLYDLPAAPQRIYFTNGSNEDIEFNVLSKHELKEYNADPTRFAGILVADGTTFRHHEVYGPGLLEDIYYVVVTGLGAAATSSITIYLIDYV